MLRITSCLLSWALLCAVSLAETYTYVDPDPLDNRTLTVFGEEAKVTFDTDTNIIDIEIEFDKSILRPDGFQIIISHGPAPSTSGEQATIFFDASTPGLPKLSAYAYNATGDTNNCGNAPGSYEVGKPIGQAPDQIESINDSSWVLSTTDQETATHRTLGARLDVNGIINHTPLYPDATFSWTGIGFRQTIGLWMWGTALSASPTYDASGYLTSWPSVDPTCIFYDFGDRATNEGPVCTGADIDLQVNVGTPVDFTITASDGDGDDLNVSYTGIPTGAAVTPNEGIQSSPVDVDFSWIPGLADAGSVTNFVATFSDSVNPSVDCPATIRVNTDDMPVCQISGAQQNVDCAGAETRIDVDGLKSFDPEGDPLEYLWSIECNGDASMANFSGPTNTIIFNGPAAGNDVECTVTLAVSDGNQSTQCKATASVNGCPQCNDTNVSDTLGLLDGNTFTMSKLVKNLASELKRVTGQAVPASVKNQVKQAKELHLEAWAAINQVPTVIQSCTNANTCVAVSHAGSISTFQNDSSELLTLIKSVAKRVKRAIKKNTEISNRKRWKRIRKKGNRLDQQNQAEASALPEVNTVCP